MKNKLIALLILGLFVLPSFVLPVFAATTPPESPGTILPDADFTTAGCQAIMIDVNNKVDEMKQNIASRESDYTEVLACAIKTGDIPLWMVPYFVRYILEFVIGIAGLVCVGGIVYGGFIYMFSGLGDDKTKGKNAIIYGLVGMVMTLLAWGFVNILISLFTG